jgi:hypothetical protein
VAARSEAKALIAWTLDVCPHLLLLIVIYIYIYPIIDAVQSSHWESIVK